VLLKRLVNTDTLIIDEVSMLHGKRLDMVNEVCQILRGSDMPFGGLQVILVGDLFQLPPVNRGNEAVDFVHTSASWSSLKPAICYLTEQHRQTNDRLLEVLNAMRRGEVEEWHVSALQERLSIRPRDGEAVTRLYAHNIDVDNINQRYLANIKTKAVSFKMESHGSARHIEGLMRSVLAPELLELKVGAEVMFVANNFAQGYVNGSRGRVVEFRDDRPIVQLVHNGKCVRVDPYSWSVQEDGRKLAEVVQLPLRLAWAITIHKSQGMSLDAAEIDLSKSFTPGMGYVALSRVRSLDGVYLTGLNTMAMRLHPAIFEFDEVLREASLALAATTSDVEEEAAHSVADEGTPVLAMNQELLGKLKMWRLKRAQTDGLPPYVIAHDSLLEALSAQPPKSDRELLAMTGIGKRKLEQYGAEILALTSPYS
jgi:ATP-dependent exoDNAse (exonuclease V) alpha subunit